MHRTGFSAGGTSPVTISDRVFWDRFLSVFFEVRKKLFHLVQWGSGEGGGEELQLQSQEDQELSAGTPARQLILNMNSEDQTVDHTNMLLWNDHDTIFVDFSEYEGQEDTNFENSLLFIMKW